MKVYLCGPINGCTDEECNDWRDAVTEHFPEAINPMVRDYRGREAECYEEIVELDKRDILMSDALLVNYSKPSVGTSMEIFFAWTKGLPIVLWHHPEVPLSPWLRYHCSTFVNTLDDAVGVLKEIRHQVYWTIQR